jgi:hypothetical protein
MLDQFDVLVVVLVLALIKRLALIVAGDKVDHHLAVVAIIAGQHLNRKVRLTSERA